MIYWMVALIFVLCSNPVFAQEKSVNPGVNKSFQSPDVEQFVSRFEREGRDAYDHRHEIIKAIGLKPGMVVADVGAGTGLFTRLFSPRVGMDGQVIAVDIAEKFVKHVEQTAHEAGLKNVIGVVCLPDSVNLPAESIDLAFICDTFHHFEFPTRTMQTIRQALKPDGQVVLIDFHRVEGASREWIMGHVRAGQEVFTKEIVDAGFEQVEEKKDILKESYFVRFKKDATVLVPLPQTVIAPKDNPTTPAKVELGKKLFFDPRLSGDNKMSCATCHMPDKACGDGLALSPGAGDKPLERNTQTCLNVGFFTTFFWDGRAASLEEQALGPIQSTVEMNQDLDALETELAAIPGYVTEFKDVFGTKPNKEGIAKALAAFQRTLVTEPSPFDRFLAGDKDALSAEAKRGLELFRGEAGCIECHNGPLLSDGKFYRLGVSFKDEGRAAITGKKEDRYRFRTPSLRNIAETGPYMHDGSQKTLDDVVTFYFRGIPDSGPDGLSLDAASLDGVSFSDIAPMVEFLKSLSGKAPKIIPPKLP
jgi:cytochrome c peroxidase